MRSVLVHCVYCVLVLVECVLVHCVYCVLELVECVQV